MWEQLLTVANIPMLVALAIVILVLLVLVYSLLSRPTYRRAGPLFTPAERRFLYTVDQAVQGHARVFGKVRLADLVTVRQRFSKRGFWRAYGPLAKKHLDYVLTDPKTYDVILVIELDDQSHDKPDRLERDAYLNRVLKKAGIPLLRVPVRRRYDVSKLRQKISTLRG